MISRTDLANYKLLGEAIRRSQNRLDELRQEHPDIVTDKVTGSNSESPYELRNFTIKGISPEWKAKQTQRIATETKELIRLKTLQWEIDELIASVSNVRHKMVLEYTIEGKGQETIAWKLGMTQANVSTILRKYTKGL